MRPFIRKMRRYVNSASTIGFTVMAILLAWLNIWVHSQPSSNGPTQTNATIIPNFVIVSAWLIFIAAIIFWVFQTWAEYDRRLHDPTWILRFQDAWWESSKDRKTAAEVLIRYHDGSESVPTKTDLDLVDDVLDILEDVGFYVAGDQISPEVAHHHLFYWIRGYWFAAQPYIRAKHGIEPTQWDNLEALYDETSRIEGKKRRQNRSNLALVTPEIVEFLAEEIEAGKADDEYPKAAE